MSRLPTALLAMLGLAVAGCGGGGGGKASAGTPAARPSAGGCERVRPPAAKPDGGRRKPSTRLDAAKTYTATLATSCGEMVVRLDVKDSPEATASFVSLARAGFFDRTAFHRIVPGFVIQGGDPTGTGSGGPGYTTRDAPPEDTLYTRGVVAMAKAADERPGTAGSQFFVVTARDAGLPPDYAVLGRVVRGQEVARRISKMGDAASGERGTPRRPVVLRRVTVDAS